MIDRARPPILEETRDASKQSVREALAQQIIDRLSAYPHFVVVKGAEPIRDRKVIEQLLQIIGGTAPGNGAKTPEQDAKLDITRVEINAKKAAQASPAGTRYSRTNQALGLHTDCPHMARPFELIAMQYVRVDAGGGDSLVIAIEDVVGSLDDGTKQALKQADFPFGTAPRPVLWDKNNATNIRYYRTNLDKAVEEGGRLSESGLAALDALDKALGRDDIVFRFHAEAGETIFLHNTKVLHGRSGFGAESNRLMYRMRVHTRCLG